MSPVNPDTCQVLRLADFQKPCLPKSHYTKLAPENTNLTTILKKNGRTTKLTEVPSRKKQVRFAVPLDDSESLFKGFTTGNLKQIDKKQAKMETIRRALSLKQRTAVWQAMQKNHGIIHIKTKSIQAFLRNKKLCSMPTKAVNLVQTQPISIKLQPEKLLRNDLNYAKMKMMQCKVCSRKAFFPGTQQNISSGNLNSFICTDCFQKPNSVMSKSLKQKISSGLPTCNSEDELPDPLEDKPIIITSVRSLATPNDLQCLDKLNKPIDLIDLEPMSPPSRNSQIEKTPARNDTDILDSSVDGDIKNEKEETAQRKKVKVWTSEGYFTFIVPKSFERQTDEFKLAFGQTSGTANDPIRIDDD